MSEQIHAPEEISELNESRLLSQADAVKAGANVDTHGNVLFTESQKDEAREEMVENLERRQEKIKNWQEVLKDFNFVTLHFPNSDASLTLRNVNDMDFGEERYRISDEPEIVSRLTIDERGEIRKIRERQVRMDRKTSDIHITELSSAVATAADLEDFRSAANLDVKQRIDRLNNFFQTVSGLGQNTQREVAAKEHIEALHKQTNKIINEETERLVNLPPEQHERRVFDTYVELMKEQVLEQFRKEGPETDIDWQVKGSELKTAESEFHQWFDDKNGQHELVVAHEKALELARDEQQQPGPERIQHGWYGGHKHQIRRWNHNEAV